MELQEKSKAQIDIILKLCLMSIIMFSVLLFHNSVRIIKDTVIVYELGAEAISFIKFWFEIPFIASFVLLYYWLYNRFSSEAIFRLVIGAYILFYSIFAFELYPNKCYYHISESELERLIILAPNFKWFLIILGNWSITIFYLFGESWATVVYSLLFWQLANGVIKLKESKTIYPFFNFLSHINLLAAGYIIQNISKNFIINYFISKNDSYLNHVQSTTVFLIFIAFIIIISHYVLHRWVLQGSYTKKSGNIFKKKIGILDSIKMVLKNRTLVLISISIVSYHVCVNLIEGIWFAKIANFYTSSEDFIYYQGNSLFYIGVCSLILTVLSGYLLKNFSWVVSAIIPPCVVLIFGAIFLFSIVIVDHFNLNSEYYYMNLILILGLLQNVFIKGSKYGIYDSVKEMQYIPLDEELKSKGKAAVDVISAKLGKSLGCLFPFVIIFVFPNLSMIDIAPVLLLLLVIFSLVWLVSTIRLGRIIKDYEK